MKIHMRVVLFALTAVSVGAAGQCTKPGLNPSWDAGKSQFICIDPAAVKGSATDESVSPKGNKDYCNKAQENLLKVCQPSDEGKTCRDKAKSIYKACYKGSNNGRVDRSGSTGIANQPSKTDPSVCATIFSQPARLFSVSNNRCVTHVSCLRHPLGNPMFPIPVYRMQSRHRINASQIAVE